MTVAASTWREPAPAPKLQDVRCRSCRRLLCRADGKGRVEVVCHKCKTLNTFRANP